VLIFSACSILSGLAHSFLVLLAARVIMGIAEGRSDPAVQQRGCQVLAQTAFANPAMKAAAVEAGALEAVVAAGRRHARDAGVLEAAAAALRNLVTAGAVQERASAAGAKQTAAASARFRRPRRMAYSGNGV
jgi:MFS family permease